MASKKYCTVQQWTIDDVSEWLREIGFPEYIESFALHKIDGDVLLHLTETDLREPPMQLTVLGDIKRMGLALDKLRIDNGVRLPTPASVGQRSSTSSDPRSEVNSPIRNSPNGRVPSSVPATITRQSSNVFLISRIESPDTEVKSLLKTLLALVYCCGSLLLTSFVMVIVHDRVPDMKTYPPLPDIFLDNVPLIPWAFEVCEILACVLGIILLIIVTFHKHRLVLLRRMFSLTGTVFCLRCVTMLITSLSVPGMHLECTNRSFNDIYAKIRQAFQIWYGMGMSLRGVRTCGDYMFSGHTTAVTLLNHFITEYTPDDWHNLHTASWVMNLFSIFFILAGHEHYSLDVFVAFYISSRLFLYYHSMAYHANNLASADARTRGWFPLFWFFESGGQLGRVPNEFGVPFGEQVVRWWARRRKRSKGDDCKVRFRVGLEPTTRNGGPKNTEQERRSGKKKVKSG